MPLQCKSKNTPLKLLMGQTNGRIAALVNVPTGHPTGDLWRRAVDRGHGVQRRDGPRWLRKDDDDDDSMQ